MRKHDPKIDLIRQIPAFTSATSSELRELATAADVVTVEAGDILCRADRRGFEAFVIVEGIVDVIAGNRTVLASLGPGEIVGELGVIDGAPRSADVVAQTDVTALVVQSAVLRPLLVTNESLRAAVLRQLAERIRKADGLLAPPA